MQKVRIITILTVLAVIFATLGLISCGEKDPGQSVSPTAAPTSVSTAPTATPTTAPTTEPTATPTTSPTIDPASFSDRDYDGLYDAVDPAPDDATYTYRLHQSMETGNGKISETDTFTIDYRKFDFQGKPEWDPGIMKTALLLNQERYIDLAKVEILNNVVTEEGTISPLGTQFGLTEMEHITLLPTDYETDKNDLCGVLLGYHIMITEDGKPLQVFFASLQSYAFDADGNKFGWISNLDVGADTPAYYAASGLHPEWVVKNEHKGFSVTAERMYKVITNYTEKHRKEGVDSMVFLFGQSRGGSLANLIGKRLTDDKIRNLTFCFNAFNCATESDPEVLNSYDSIFVIENDDDFGTCVPAPSWNNFTCYGRILHFSVLEKDLARWEERYHNVYGAYPKEKADAYRELARTLVSDRSELYEIDPNTEKERYVCATEAEAEKKKENLLKEFSGNTFALTNLHVWIERDDARDRWIVKSAVSPAMILDMVSEIKGSNTGFDIFRIAPYTKYVVDLAGGAISTFIKDLPNIDVATTNPHLCPADLIGVDIMVREMQKGNPVEEIR